jgi:hypothetical protein
LLRNFTDAGGRHLSDHLPVIADIRVAEGFAGPRRTERACEALTRGE